MPYRDKEKHAAWRLANKERIAAYRRDPEKTAAWNAAFRKANPEYFKEYYRSERYRALDAKRKATPEYRAKEAIRRKKALASPEYRAKRKAWDALRDPAKAKVYRKSYWARPEVLAAQRERLVKRLADPVKRAVLRARQQLWAAKPEIRARYSYRHGTPVFKLQRRMSAAVRRCLRGNKRSGSKWLNLVGYTAEELHAHIEKQFLPSMGWHNMPKWHIDHIVPLASFTFEAADDPEFKAAWALTNLRPLWGLDNLRKRDRRELLL